MKIHLIAGARPNFMKIAPLYRHLSTQPDFDVKIVHTGQHYDTSMSDYFFADLTLPTPHYHLGTNTGTQAEQTGAVLVKYERLCQDDRPDMSIVVGDVNSTLACALTAAKLSIPVAHLESGLRSGDRTMPEEINRIVTDQLSDLLWTHSPEADDNLRREGIDPRKIDRVGNAMIDTLVHLLPKIRGLAVHERLGFSPQTYLAVTFHRPANVDDDAAFSRIVDQVESLSSDYPVVWPVHPRAMKALERIERIAELRRNPGVQLIDPLGYLDFMSLVHGSRLVLTDSGGIQEETSYLGIPCLTVRPNTERPITLTHGTNELVSPANIISRVEARLLEPSRSMNRIPAWDGRAAERIVESLRNFRDSRNLS